MRDSGEKFNPHGLGKVAVDKHSTGGVATRRVPGRSARGRMRAGGAHDQRAGAGPHGWDAGHGHL